MTRLFITLLTSLSFLLGQGITPVSAALPVYTAETANEAISSEIGTQAKVGELTDGEHGIGTATQLGLHALTGCASAALQSGDCGAGALGQVTGEVVGMLYNENTDMADIDGDGYISDSEESVWRDKGVELAGNVTQAVLTATGADAHDIAIGTTNAKTAAENNAMSHIARGLEGILGMVSDANHAATVIHRGSPDDFTPEQKEKFGEPVKFKDADGKVRYGYFIESLRVDAGNFGGEGKRLVPVVNGKMNTDNGWVAVPEGTFTMDDYVNGNVNHLRVYNNDEESRPFEDEAMEQHKFITLENSPYYPSNAANIDYEVLENRASSEKLPNSNTDARVFFESSGRSPITYGELESKSGGVVLFPLDQDGLLTITGEKSSNTVPQGGITFGIIRNEKFNVPGYLPEDRIPAQD